MTQSDQHSERAQGYKTLAECFYLPTEQLGEMLVSVRDSAPEGALSGLADEFRGAENLDALKVDYTKLFLGPFKALASPYGSVHLEQGHRVMGDTTMAAIHIYESEGLNVVLREAPDHVAVELEFMAVLCIGETEGITDSDDEKIAHYREKQQRFLEAHLGRWVVEFTDLVQKHAETSFYRTLGQVTQGVVQAHLEELKCKTS